MPMPSDDGAPYVREIYSPKTHETWFGRWPICKEFADALRAWANKDYIPMERKN